MYRCIITKSNLRRPCISRTTSTSINQKATLGLRSKHDVVKQVPQLPDWDLEAFRERAFNAKHPIRLPYTPSILPKACTKWFIHDGGGGGGDTNYDYDYNNKLDINTQPNSSELKPEFWSEYGFVSVPLEFVSVDASNNNNNTPSKDSIVFHRSEAPLEVLLAYLNDTRTSRQAPQNEKKHQQQQQQQQKQYTIYLGQCDLNSLPASLRNDIPTPTLVKSSGRGDIYSSSLWLGRPPTYTPLHRDPNPNLFWQLAGQKVVRLLPPEIGDAIFDDVQAMLLSSSSSSPPPAGRIKNVSSASFRGEEMMHGPERELLHRLVWAGEADLLSSSSSATAAADVNDVKQVNWVTAYAMEAKLGFGEALFIPKGWWHSVKGVGEGVTASVNWWFR